MTWPGPDDVRILEEGEIEVLGLLPRASNYTFLAASRLEGKEALAVYKPRRGEIPLWDFPNGTLCRREVAAYVLARALGWPAVPPTVLRDGPEGLGSAQLFVEFDPGQHYFTMRSARRDYFRKVALFDAVANNADRKAGHCLLHDDGTVYLVDHGVCFNVEPKLRTVIWDFAGEPISEDLCSDLTTLEADLREGPLRHELSTLLAAGEIDAAAARTRSLVAAGRLPRPGPGYPYPWPPV